ELPTEVAERVFGRIKFLARLKTYQESLPQDGRIDRGELGTRSDVRVATYPTVTGEKIVLRLFQSSSAKMLRELALPADAGAAVELVLNQRLARRLCRECAGQGCGACWQTGYRGRVPIAEFLRVTDAMRRQVAANELDGLAAKPSLLDNARALVETGLTNQA